MNNQITTRDIELLSAYLDNQLNSKERTLLETRLKADPALRKELQEINSTRQLLRQLPRMRAPRNYYVKPESVRSRPTLRLAPVFGVISAVASVLLVMVVIGSRISTPTSRVAMSPAIAPITQSALTAPQESTRVESPSEQPTQAAPPALVMGAEPAFSPTSTPFVPPTESGPTEAATPTTIYLFAFPPTSTPETQMSIAGVAAVTPTPYCELYGTEPLPGYPDQFECVTPTSTPSPLMANSLQATTPTNSPTPSVTPTETSSPTETPTSTPTASPTPTATPSPTETPTSTAAESADSQLASSSQKALPTDTPGYPADQTVAGTGLGPENLATTIPPQAETTTGGNNSNFLNSILLTAEISLAVIAVLAGLTAIILRIRSR